MSRDFPFSPSALTEYRDNPLKKITDKFFLRRSNASNMQDYSSSKVGREVHAYVEDAFKYLESQKSSLTYDNPNNDYIQKVIFDAQERAKGALSLKTSMHMSQGANKIIKTYGEQFLKDKNKSIFVEHKMTGEVSGQKGKHYMGGIADLIMLDAQKKHAEIIDTKNILSNNIVDVFDNADKSLQPKSYSFMFHQEMKNKGIDLDSIKFTFAKNMANGDVDFSSFDFSSKQIMGQMQNDLAVELSKAEAINAMSYKILQETKEPGKALTKIHREIMLKHGGCNPGFKCNSCMMRYSCGIKLSAGIKDKLTGTDGITGLTDDTDIINKLSDEHKTMLQKFTEAQNEDMYDRKYHLEKKGIEYYEKRAEKISNGIYQSRRKQLLERGMTIGPDLFDTLNTEIDILKDSQKTVQKFKRGQFEDSILTSGLEAKMRMPTSLISDSYSGDLTNPLISSRLSRNISTVSNDILSNIFENLDMDRPGLHKQIINDMYSDSRFLSKFLPVIEENAAATLKKENLDPTIKNIHLALSSAQHMIDDNVMNMIETGLNERVINHLHKHRSNELSSNINSRHLNERMQTKAIFGEKAVSTTREAIREKLSKFDSGFSITEKFSFSAPKGTLGTITKAMILTQIAGNQTIYNLFRNKLDKATTFEENKNKGIDTGEHYSTYTAMRRLILSDFGSETREFNPTSSIYSMVAAKGSSILSKAKQAISEAYTSLSSGKYNAEFLTNNKDALKYGGVAALAAFAFMTIIPRTLTGKEQQEHNYQKKKSLKKERQTNNTSDSYNQTPSSDLRSRYKLHTDFGSPAFLKKGAALMFQKIDISEILDYVKKLGSVSAGKASEHYKSSLRNIITKSSALDVAEEISSEVADDSRAMFIRRIKNIKNEAVSKFENSVAYAKNRVYSNTRSGELSKVADKNQYNINSKSEFNKVGAVIDDLSEEKPKIKKNNFPAIKKTEPSDKRNIVLRTSSGTELPETQIKFNGKVESSDVKYPRIIRKPNIPIPDMGDITRRMKNIPLDQASITMLMGNTIPAVNMPVSSVVSKNSPHTHQYITPASRTLRDTEGQNYMSPGLFEARQYNNTGNLINKDMMNIRKNYKYGTMFKDLEGFLL